MTHPVLSLQDFCVSYGPVEAVHGINLSVNEGEIVTVIGPNGAGKTTLLCAAMGLLPSQGTLTLAGRTIPRPSVEAMVFSLIAAPDNAAGPLASVNASVFARMAVRPTNGSTCPPPSGTR